MHFVEGMPMTNKSMANLGDYATTLKDILAGKTSVKNAIWEAKNTPGGVLSPPKSTSPMSNWPVVVKGDKTENTFPSSGGGSSSSSGGGGSSSGGYEGGYDEKAAKKAEDDAKKAADKAEEEEKKRIDAVRKAIGNAWGENESNINRVSDELSKSQEQISSLGKARDEAVGAAQKYLDKTKTAIQGNRELIGKNQKEDLDDLAEEVRRSIFDTNLRLGVLGAADSSAAGAASKALSQAAGKNRQSILTGYGDQYSEQNQEEQKAFDRFNTARKNAYDWEERSRKQAIQEYQMNKAVLDRLKDRVPDWKKADIEEMNTENLSTLLGELSQISAKAKNWRDQLNSWLTEMQGKTAETEMAAVDVTKPYQLDTPEFSDELDLGSNEDEEDQEDFYNPDAKKKKQLGKEILGNPLVFDEVPVV